MATTRVSNGKVISTDNPNRKVGQTFNEKPAPNGPSNRDPVASGVSPLTAEQKTIAGTLQDHSANGERFDTPEQAAKSPIVPVGQPPAVNGNTFANPATPTALPNQSTPTQTAFAAAQASGIAAPQDAGLARAQATQFMPPKQPDTSNIDLALQEDKGYQQLLADRADFTNVANQGQSLLKQYNQMIKQAGIPGINEELLNTQKIINGTEDDIRKEVQAVSGFATDSQVLALSSARNKQLIQNYNNLVETKKQAMESINTMIGLAQQDQQNALQNITQKMAFDQQIISYRDKFVDNAKEGFNNVIRAVGYAGLLNSLQQDPSSIPLVERTLGLAPGGLQQLASYTPPQSEEEKLKLQGLRLNNQGQTLQNQKLQQDLSGTVGGVDEKTMTKIQASPEYKTINGVLPAIQALTAYKQAVQKYGAFESLSGQGKGELAATYGNAIAAWKTLAGLGALSGADFALAENAVPSTGFFQRNSVVNSKITFSLDNAITQAETLTNRLIQNYPRAKDNLQLQLDQAKVIAYPDRFKVGTDGQVYELTN